VGAVLASSSNVFVAEPVSGFLLNPGGVWIERPGRPADGGACGEQLGGLFVAGLRLKFHSTRHRPWTRSPGNLTWKAQRHAYRGATRAG
jgi:hypothetical protein